MATVTTRYRCPVTPDDCPTSSRRGFCKVHEWEQLVPERVFLTADQTPGTDSGGGNGADHGLAHGADNGGETDGSAGAAAPSARTASARTASPKPAPRKPASPEPAPQAGPANGTRGRPRDTRAGRPRPAADRQSRPRPTAVRIALVLAGALVPIRGAGEEPTRVGRDAPECAHVPGLAGLEQLSRAHAELTWRGDRLYIRDTCSANGTYVDGEEITDAVQLWPGRHRLRLAQDIDVSVVELDEYGAPR